MMHTFLIMVRNLCDGEQLENNADSSTQARMLLDAVELPM